MSFADWIHVSNNFISCSIKTIRKVEDVQHYKLAELMGSKLHHNPNKIIHNFSSYQLSEIEKSLLCKGLNFALPPKKLKFENYLLPLSWQKNSFPLFFIDKCVKKFLDKLFIKRKKVKDSLLKRK